MRYLPTHCIAFILVQCAIRLLKYVDSRYVELSIIIFLPLPLFFFIEFETSGASIAQRIHPPPEPASAIEGGRVDGVDHFLFALMALESFGTIAGVMG